MIIIVMHVLATDVPCTGIFNYSSLILVIMEFTFYSEWSLMVNKLMKEKVQIF